jgi:hypothetical protein
MRHGHTFSCCQRPTNVELVRLVVTTPNYEPRTQVTMAVLRPQHAVSGMSALPSFAAALSAQRAAAGSRPAARWAGPTTVIITVDLDGA